MLGHDWVPGEGTLVDIRYSGHENQVGATGQEPHFLMDVRPSVGEPFRAEVDELPLFFSFKAPAFGQVVQLECDPGRKKARFVRSDPAINRKPGKQAAKAAYEAELHAGVSAPEPAEEPLPPDPG
jgi:hypothetical protein